MYADVDKQDNAVNVYAEEDDLCYLCTYVDVCPLLAAVQNEAVVLRYESIGIEKCGMYEEYRFNQMLAF